MKRTFISFDYDHDNDLKTMLVGQAKLDHSPFTIADWSVKEHIYGDWQSKVRSRIKQVDIVVFICGEHTENATGVNAELKIAQEEQKPYFLLWGRSAKTCKRPLVAKVTDKIYNWTWDNLKSLIGGSR
jgi:hypothetical protein